MTLPRRTTTERDRAADHADGRIGAGPRLGISVLALLAVAACSKDSSGPKPSLDCSNGGTTAPAIGNVMSSVPGTSLCAGGGSSGAEYVLIPFNSSTQSGKATFQVEATGVVAPGSPLFSLVPGKSGGAADPLAAQRPIDRRDTGFEARLRARESALSSLIPAARQRAELRSRATLGSRAVIPANPVVGQRLQLNTNSDNACGEPIFATGRVVAVTRKSIVVADTANPANGFTDADYESIAATFDNVVDPVITANFGQPADIDGNERILLFFTRSVNEMTPADNNGAYVGGFFFGRDLFPTTGTTNSAGCASSNFGELFYLLVPDPTGIINGNDFSTADVREIAVSIVAHEYQHLINASRRMYVNTGARDFEETWLNEGLSHIGEELLFYARASLAPRRDITPTLLRNTPGAIDAFNNDMGANFGRFRRFLENPSLSSPYSANDSLTTRGAAWEFLRYAADQQTAAQAGIWFSLVNSTTTGLANIRNVFGPNSTVLFRDWSTSVFTDNLPGVAARYQEPSWNFRAIYPAITNPPTYPLQTFALVAATPRSVELIGGGSAYLRFKVPAGESGQVTWGTIPSTVLMTLVRTR